MLDGAHNADDLVRLGLAIDAIVDGRYATLEMFKQQHIGTYVTCKQANCPDVYLRRTLRKI